MDFFDFIEEQGIVHGEATAIFVERFLDDRSVFFQLSESEQKEMERKIDEILNLFLKTDTVN